MTASPVLLSRVSTDGVAPADRIAFWEEHSARALVGLACTSYSEEGLRARQTNLRVGALGLTDISGNAHVIERTPRICRDLPKDSVFASLVLQGEAVFFHSGGCLTLRAGDLVLYDTTKPYLFGFSTSMRKLLVDLPREAFKDRFSRSGLPAPLALGDGAPSRALRSFLLNTAEGAGPGEATDAQEVVLGLLQMAATQHPRGFSSGHLLQLVVAKDHIERHLHDPGLSARRVADALGISVRHLSRVFEPEGLAPARYLLDRRLTRARELLADPARHHRRGHRARGRLRDPGAFHPGVPGPFRADAGRVPVRPRRRRVAGRAAGRPAGRTRGRTTAPCPASRDRTAQVR